MAAPRSNNPGGNRPMFRRIVRRLLFANRGRLFVILLALSAGAAVSAALLNLQTDAKRRITSDFRSFGPNVLILPHNTKGAQTVSTFSDSVLQGLPPQDGQKVPAIASLYAAATVTAYSDESINRVKLGSGQLVLTGYRVNGEDSLRVLPRRILNPNSGVVLDVDTCDVGERVAEQFKLQFGAALQWEMNGKTYTCIVAELQSFGGPEDDRVFTDLASLQEETHMKYQVSVIQMRVPGTAKEIEDYVSLVRQKFPDLEVRPLRQFSEAQAKIYSRISSLLTAATAIILVLTALCVMAAMTNIAAERKQDVGMMKAIGGSARNVLSLFLAEAVLLGLAGGLIGAAAGIALSIALGKAVFGVAAAPRLIVYPISVALTIIVAILGAYPLRRLTNVRPATIFRGEA